MSAATPPDDDDKLLDALDAGEPARTPEETAARLPYQRLIERIQDLDEISPPPGWEERAEQRWRARRVDARKRRQRRAILGLSLGGAALAAALLLRPCASTPKPETPPPLVQAQVAIKTIHSGPPRRGDDVLVGDKLVAQAPVDGTHVELRIYLGDKLFARCPAVQSVDAARRAWRSRWSSPRRGPTGQWHSRARRPSRSPARTATWTMSPPRRERVPSTCLGTGLSPSVAKARSPVRSSHRCSSPG